MKLDHIIDGIMWGALAAAGGISVAYIIYLVLVMNGVIV